MLKTMYRGTAALALMALTACGDATGGDRLAPEEVAARYQVCSLVFTPEQAALPAVNIQSAAFETENATVTRPFFAVDIEPQTFQLRYTPKGQFSDRDLTGRYTIRGNELSFDFQAGVTPSGLLLPDPLRLEFTQSPMSLATEATDFYDVARGDYTRLAGISESGLAERIRGRLMARFAYPTCG